MHIEPGLVDGAKIVFSYATATAAGGTSLYHIAKASRTSGIASVAVRSLIATVGVFIFFEVLPHFPVGVSEVHFILGSTLFLILGAGPASIGLALGLLIQGLFFAPFDLPQYGMNVTTLLVPLFATAVLARRIIPKNVAYVDLSYQQAFKLSVAYQGGIVVWVGFWALYGRGTGLENLSQIASFGAAYMTVVLVEPLVDLGVLAAAKGWRRLQGSVFVERRLYGGV